jgi:hypothetical protein
MPSSVFSGWEPFVAEHVVLRLLSARNAQSQSAIKRFGRFNDFRRSTVLVGMKDGHRQDGRTVPSRLARGDHPIASRASAVDVFLRLTARRFTSFA